MFQSMEIFRMSAAMAEHASRRQALAAQNMANVDTPEYQALRLAPFSEIVAKDGFAEAGFGLRATRPGHFQGTPQGISVSDPEVVKVDPAPDGNTVSPETELLESVGARREHDRALAIYKSTLKILHATLARS